MLSADTIELEIRDGRIVIVFADALEVDLDIESARKLANALVKTANMAERATPAATRSEYLT